MSRAVTHAGALPSGSRYVAEAPENWNGVLLLFSKPVPVAPGEPPWQHGDPLIDQLVGSGYAVAGSANTIFWPLELAFSDQPALLDTVERLIGPARHTIGIGLSIGGIITAGLVQRFPERLSGALPMCGNLAGAVGNHNRELDIAFVIRTLLEPDSSLQLVHITDPDQNLRRARAVLTEAQASAAGRARLALAAAMGNIPGWNDPLLPQAAAEDFVARQRNQFAWFDQVGFLIMFWAREQVEQQAGGNPSWNTGVDYGDLLDTSINRDEVEALYTAAALNLQDDLARLASETRIDADLEAVAYLEQHIVFSGELNGIPVLTVHTDGDGLVTPDNERAYAEVVELAGHQEFLRQLYIHRGGHCSFTAAEILTALGALLGRIESGSWPSLEPAALNASADALGVGVGANLLPPGQSTAAAFFDYRPERFPRQYDARSKGGWSG
ncbi:MAG: hypothetical protein ACR2JU_15590 [Nocardioidaceae bacterium]